MSSISTTITTGISIGAGGYASPLTITSAGAVAYAGYGNAVYGAGTLVNLGTISEGGATPNAGYAVTLAGGGAVTNGQAGDGTAFIDGGSGVVFATGAAPSRVSNDGTIIGYGNEGVVLGSGGSISNGAGGVTAALIQGYAAGVSSLGGNSATVTNAGTIQATDPAAGGYGVLVQGDGTVTNLGSDAVITGNGGISIALAGSVSNAGTILTLPAGYSAVVIQGAGYVANTGPAALIEGFGGVTIGGAGTVANSGTIELTATGRAYVGVDIHGAGTVTNTGSTALIAGYRGGVGIGGTGTVDNAGTIQATGYYSHSYAIVIGAGTVSNTGTASLIEGQGGVSITASGSVLNAGTILSNYYRGNFGVFIGGGGSIGNLDAGAVIAGYGGVYAGQAATVSNLGTIESNEYSALGGNAGVKLADGGTVLNTGTGALLYGSVALYVENAAGTVTNTGVIRSQEGLGTGIRLTAGGTIVNGAADSAAATIYGSQYGVLVTAGAATIGNFGAISGAILGLQLDGGGTVVDSGQITGGEAIAFGGTGNNLLVVQPGYAIIGGVAAAGSGNTLELQGNINASVTANYTSLGLTGFQTVAFAPGAGAYASLVISNYGALPGTITGFTGFNDSIDLASLSDAGNDASVSFDSSSGVLTVTGDGADAALQLGGGSYAGVTWAAANDGSNGTVVYRSSGGAQDARPSITGIAGAQGVVAGDSATPFSAVAIQDTSSGATDTVTVTLSDADGGTLSDFGTGSFDSSTGVYTATGTPAVVSGDLDALAFTPVAAASGAVGATTGFTLAVTGPGGSASDGTTSVTPVTQILGLGASAPADIAISASPDGSSFAAATPGDTNEAVVTSPTLGNTYVLPAGYQAEFLGASSDAVTLSDPSVGNALLVGNAAGGTIVSGAGHDTLLGGGGDPTLQFTAGASDGLASVPGGNVTLLDAGSHDTLIGGTGTTTASISGANSSFLGQTGASSVTAGGHGDVLAGGTSQAIFQFTTLATDGIAVGGAGTLTLLDAGSHDTIMGAAGASTVSLSGGNALFLGTTGSASIVASGHADTLAGGAGSMAASLTGSDAVILGQGTLSVADTGIGDTIAAAGAASTVMGAGTSALLLGGTGHLTASIGGAGNTVAGGAGATAVTIQGSSGVVLGGTGGLSVLAAGFGDTISPFGASSAQVSITGGNAVLLGGSAGFSASLAGTGALVAGGAGPANITVADIGFNTANLVLGGAGSLTLAESGQRDTVAAFAASAANVSIGGARNLVLGGSHGMAVSIGGANNTIIGGSGPVTLAAGATASGTELLGGGGRFVVNDAGSQDTIASFGASSASITVSGSNALVFGGSNPASIDAAGAGATIAAGSGALAVTSGGGSTGLLVLGGSGRLNFVGGGGAATIVAGQGATTVQGGSGGTVLFGAAGGAVAFTGSVGDGLTYSAGAGNETLDASLSTANNIMYGGADPSGGDSIVGGQGIGQGNDTLVGGAGPDTLVGNSDASSQDWFVFFAGDDGGAPQEVVENMTSSDEVWLVGYGASAAAAALGSAVSHGGSTTITLSDNTTITFTDIASASALAGSIISS